MTWEDVLQNHRTAASGTRSRAKGTAYTDVCVQCKQAQPRFMFKRWHGKKRATFKVCNACHPEKTIREMSDSELQAWMTSQGVSASVQAQVWADRKARLSEARAEAGRVHKVAQWSLVRRELWAPVLTLIRAEKTRYQRYVGAMDVPQRVAFAEYYIRVLDDLNYRIRRTISHGLTHDPIPYASTFRILPGVEKEGLLTMVTLDIAEDWAILISDSDLRKLSILWSDCAETQTRGRPLTEPAFLRGAAK